jgi:hypothetical protein
MIEKSINKECLSEVQALLGRYSWSTILNCLNYINVMGSNDKKLAERYPARDA